MRRLVTFLVVTIVALSSVCGACAVSYDKLHLVNECKPVASEEWTIEITKTVTDNSNDNKSNSEFFEDVQFCDGSFDNGEWTIHI